MADLLSNQVQASSSWSLVDIKGAISFITLQTMTGGKVPDPGILSALFARGFERGDNSAQLVANDMERDALAKNSACWHLAICRQM